jgi:hypothetical protein
MGVEARLQRWRVLTTIPRAPLRYALGYNESRRCRSICPISPIGRIGPIGPISPIRPILPPKTGFRQP